MSRIAREGCRHDQPDCRIRVARRGVPRGRTGKADHHVRTGAADTGPGRLSGQGHAVVGAGGTGALASRKGGRIRPGRTCRQGHGPRRGECRRPDPPVARLSPWPAGTCRWSLPLAPASRSRHGFRGARLRPNDNRLAAGRRKFRGAALSAVAGPDDSGYGERGNGGRRANPPLAPPGAGRPTSADHPAAGWGSKRTAEEP